MNPMWIVPVVLAWVSLCIGIAYLLASWRKLLWGKPHVVRFEDGTYGVRRWDLYWEFLGCSRHGKDVFWHWWSIRCPEEWGRFTSEVQAREFLVAWRRTDKTTRPDIGRKV